jgi:D-alanyl-D-alanine carboxypeptidase/D-alanyl-D-alanine-endopeptidase (penicillin-binding protein 4)
VTAHKPVNFQLKPNQIERQKVHQAKWRRLESAIRTALHGQAVNIIYRGDELVVTDNQSDANKVWASLQSIVQKYPFAVMLSSRTLAINPTAKPALLWVQATNTTNQAERVWTIKESAQ